VALPNNLFRCRLRVRPGPDSEMPSHLKGALVDCFAAAPDHLMALRQIVDRLASKGILFDELVDEKVHQLDPLQWDAYLQAAWPEFRSHFPSQAELTQLIAKGGAVFFGPFCSWETEEDTDGH
jgi:hypothetical protein